jgi:hypothetical protein
MMTRTTSTTRAMLKKNSTNPSIVDTYFLCMLKQSQERRTTNSTEQKNYRNKKYFEKYVFKFKIKKENIDQKRFSELLAKRRKTFRLLHLPQKIKKWSKNGRTKKTIYIPVNGTDHYFKIKSIK